jgi:hypothetical protein
MRPPQFERNVLNTDKLICCVGITAEPAEVLQSDLLPVRPRRQMQPGLLPLQEGRDKSDLPFDGKVLPYDLLDFWQWSVRTWSTDRQGRLAEYMVARALQIPLTVRHEWIGCGHQTAE